VAQGVAVPSAGVNERRVKLVLGGVQLEQQFEHPVVDPMRVGMFAVDLVDDDDHF
jgi:hypothetical protein